MIRRAKSDHVPNAYDKKMQCVRVSWCERVNGKNVGLYAKFLGNFPQDRGGVFGESPAEEADGKLYIA